MSFWGGSSGSLKAKTLQLEGQQASHSSYEGTNLGDDERNQKFMRLMGGSKKSGAEAAAGQNTKTAPGKHDQKSGAEAPAGHTETAPGQLDQEQFVPGPEAEHSENVPEQSYEQDAPAESTEEPVAGCEPKPHIQVQSANKWEKVNLGDEDRRDKFLRLMGASKKDHQGKIVIGDHKAADHGRKVEEVQKADDELEEQFLQGIDQRQGRRHKGLGFAGMGDDPWRSNWEDPWKDVPTRKEWEKKESEKRDREKERDDKCESDRKDDRDYNRDRDRRQERNRHGDRDRHSDRDSHENRDHHGDRDRDRHDHRDRHSSRDNYDDRARNRDDRDGQSSSDSPQDLRSHFPERFGPPAPTASQDTHSDRPLTLEEKKAAYKKMFVKASS